LTAAAALLLGAYVALGHSVLGIAGTLILVLTAFIAYFFRDPDRVTPPGDGLVVSAGDGRVVEVKNLEGGPEVGGGGFQVSVFLSIFDVHVNRIPIAGRVLDVVHQPGKFRLAFVPAASEENEQTIVRLETESGIVIVKQIAGYVARRIVCHLRAGDSVQTGNRYGLIKFGSRIDHILPRDADIRVNVGDRVRAGETVIGVLPQ
jgi:phosphatidylserine decarboxylase